MTRRDLLRVVAVAVLASIAMALPALSKLVRFGEVASDTFDEGHGSPPSLHTCSAH